MSFRGNGKQYYLKIIMIGSIHQTGLRHQKNLDVTKLKLVKRNVTEFNNQMVTKNYMVYSKHHFQILTSN